MTATRPEVLPIWAESGEKVQPNDEQLQIGWPFTNTPPSRQRFNWILNNLANAAAYNTRRGIPDWSAEETYEAGDITQSGGIGWVSLASGNINHPPAEGTYWKPWSAEPLIAEHDASETAHPDIRGLIEALSSGRRDRGIVLSAWAPMQTGLLTAMAITNGGAGYQPGDVLYISIPGATEIPAWAIISGVDENNGAAQSLTIINPGAFTDISAPGNAIVQQGTTNGAGLLASCTFSTGNGQTLNNISDPTKGDAVVVLHSEVAGGGAAWVWLYADQNGDGISNWIPAGGPTGQSNRNLPFFASGEPLPVSNIGPIWHDDYNSIMTWQVFNQNGANYTGYASQMIGSLLLDTQPTPRAGYIASGVQNLNRVAYAALRAWGMHNGLFVAQGAWLQGRILMCDNTDGETFRVFDVRGEFLRSLDGGRGVDAGRVFGSFQEDNLKSHNHDYGIRQGISSGSIAAFTGGNFNSLKSTTDNTGGTETRPRNVALLAQIKY